MRFASYAFDYDFLMFHHALRLHYAGNFLKEKDRLTFYEKKARFEKMNALHPTSKVNMLHVSINFHPSETISEDLIKSISEKYMQGIGLPEQPFLVYQHFDAAHPHFHIVTNLIRPDGTRFRTNNLGRNQSRKAADALEKEYNLVKAKEQKRLAFEVKAVDPKKIRSAKVEVKKSIQEVLRYVLKEYKVASIPELNAILAQYNVQADPGKMGSRVNTHKGLLYKVIGEDGRATTVPIKASAFPFKPTLINLEIKFAKDKELKKDSLRGIKTRIDWTLRGQPETLEQLQADLLKEGIQLIIYQNTQGRIYGATYIDYKSKTVVKGSDLGHDYGAKGLTTRFNGVPQELHPSEAIDRLEQMDKPARRPPKLPTLEVKQKRSPDKLQLEGHILQPLTDLLRPEEVYNALPMELRPYKKKKRKKR